ncbi:hypothetical protein [Absidia glauca]|uniref:Uncharacterized protein n=1 Tax=Absidia glauca TaxID=4829 RepID=A0A163IYH2_ABSGL|nr:hypothetical protein [Absidia glauca]
MITITSNVNVCVIYVVAVRAAASRTRTKKNARNSYETDPITYADHPPITNGIDRHLPPLPNSNTNLIRHNLLFHQGIPPPPMISQTLGNQGALSF